MNSTRKVQFDDVFDIFSMLIGSNYVTAYDTKLQLTRFSPAIVEMLDLPGEYVEDGAYNWLDYVHPEDRILYDNTMKEMYALRKHTYDLTYRVRLKDGSYSMFRFVGGLIRDADGHPSIAGGMMIPAGLVDHTDRVTNLKNLHAFLEDAREPESGESILSLLLIGFGRLTHINEVYGYAYGSRVLIRVAETLREMAGENGEVYHLEGSKFAIISHKFDRDTLPSFYESIREQYKTGIEVDGIVHNLVAYGGCMYLSDDITGTERSFFDCLLYAYSESRRYRHGNLVTYSGSLAQDEGTTKAISLISKIRQCLIEDFEGFFLLYQPIFSLKDNKPTGAEVILRWHSDEFGVVKSHSFLSEIEQDYTFERLGTWMIRKMLIDGRDFLKADPDFTVFIRLSPAQINAPYIVNDVEEIANHENFPLKHLAILIPREFSQVEMSKIISLTTGFQSLGIRVGIDSFGTARTWLSLFREIRPDFVRFPEETIQLLPDDEHERTIFRHLVSMAVDCNAEVYVNGVNNNRILEILSDMAVNGVQGAALKEPIYFDEVLDYYDSEDINN